MTFDFDAVDAANKLVAAMDKRNTNVYVTLAKAALWMVAIATFIVMSAAIVKCLGMYRNGLIWEQPAGVIIQAGQLLSMLAITVLGFHGYKGSRIFHVLRNWKHEKDSP